MNKLLLASTALVASTTFAMADVDVSGFAEMGIFGGEDSSGDDIDTQFHSDIDVIFSMSGETDAGLTFGALIELDGIDGDDDEFDDGAFDATESGSDTSIFVSGDLGTLTMGDTDGAFDFALQEAIIGADIQDTNEHAGYDNGIVGGNSGLDGTYDGQVARYDYSFGDFSVAVSAEIDDDPDQDILDTDTFEAVSANLQTEFAETDNDTVLGIGMRYSGEFGSTSFGAGLGYQRAGMDDITIFANGVEVTQDDIDDGTVDPDDIDDVDVDSMSATAIGGSLDVYMDNGIQAILNYSEYDEFASGLDNHIGVAVGYEFDAFLVALNWGKFEYDDGGEDEGVALIGNYDLGGGAELQAGYGNSDVGGEDSDSYSFGISMSF
jgi:outer membrane protein OmpU